MPSLLLLVCCCCQVPTQDAEDFPKQLQVEAITATVRLSDPQREVQGTGVMIAANECGTFVLTAAHLVDRSDQLEVQLVHGPVVSEGRYDARAARTGGAVRYAAGPGAVALARVQAAATDAAALPTACDSRHHAIPCLVIGCESGHAPKARVDRVIARQRPAARQTTNRLFFGKSKASKAPANPAARWLTSADLYWEFAAGNNKEKSYFCHIEEIHAFLAKHKLQWLYDPKKPPQALLRPLGDSIPAAAELTSGELLAVAARPKCFGRWAIQGNASFILDFDARFEKPWSS